MKQPQSVVAVISGSLALGALTAYRAELGAIAAVAVGALALVVWRPYVLAIGLVAWSVVRFPVLQAYPVLFWPVNGAEAAVLALVVTAAVGRLRGGRHWLFERRWPWTLAGLFVLASLVSAGVNQSTPLQVVMGLRAHFIVPLAAVSAALLVDTERDRRMAIRVAVFLVLIQVPVGMGQFLLSGSQSKGPDIVFGTLGSGGSNNLGFLMLGIMAAFAGEYVRTRKPVLLAGLLACAPVFVFTSARLGLMISPLVLLAALAFAHVEPGRGLGVSRRTIVALVTLTSALALVGVYYEYRPLTIQRDLSPQYFLTDQGIFIERGVSRAGYLFYGVEFVRARAPIPALGTGPASASSGAAANLGTPLSREFLYGLQLFGRSNTTDPSRPGYVPLPPQIAADLVEYGWIGTGLFMSFAVGIGLTLWRRLRDAPFAELAPVPFLLWFGLYTFGAAYTSSWEGFSIIGLGFWWWAIALSDGRRAS